MNYIEELEALIAEEQAKRMQLEDEIKEIKNETEETASDEAYGEENAAESSKV
jgi:hypothetical protein